MYLESLVGKLYEAKKLNTGEVLIQVDNKEQFVNILAHSRMVDVYIKITPHCSLNCYQGVICDRYFISETEAHLLECLRDEGVMTVTQITVRLNDKIIQTQHIIDVGPLNTS